MTRTFECIVVGAGPAGLTAALVLARAGVEVLVLERGEYPGAKNIFGGVLYSKGLHRLIPDFWDEAPVERPVARWSVSFLDATSSLALDFKSTRFCEAPYNAFTVLRSRFDHWYARKAEEAGAVILAGTLVEDLLWDNDRVVGVKTGRPDGEIAAPVVIAADGVNSLVARRGYPGKELDPDHVSLGVKEILVLPEAAIHRAFSLSGSEGAAHTYVGAATNGIPGGGFIYTNRESLSVGVVTKLSSLAREKRTPEELLEAFKHHPHIAPLIRDGEPREYLAHLIPDGYRPSRGPLYQGGLLVAGDAAGFTLSTGLRVEGANYGIASGIAAAETVKRARQLNDFSHRGLSAYPDLLREQGVLVDMETYRHAPAFFKNPRMYQAYPELACRLGGSLFGVEPEPKKGLFTLFKEANGERVSWSQLARDAWDGWRALS